MPVVRASEDMAGPSRREGPPEWPAPDSLGADADLPLLLGETLAEKYVLEDVLGTGGMGVVCRALHVELEQLVAVKFLRKRFAQERTVVARFLEEARAAAALRSDHAVRVMDVGQTSSGIPYYVMEHLEGTDLETLLVREGPLRITRALDYVRQACAALHEAHALGIVHRDIKPENLFLATRNSEKSVLKVVDFGIAKRLDPARAKVVTGPQDHLGSPCYMSPEQMWTPRSVDTRTDVWSLGVVLYQLLTCRLPFDGESVSEVFARVASAEFTPVSALRPDVDPYLDAIVRRCLEKSLDLRYGSVDALADDLERYERTVLSATDPSVRFATEPVRTPSDAPVAAPLRTVPPGRRPIGIWSFRAAMAVALLGLVTARRGGPTPFDRVRSMAAGRFFPAPLAAEVPASEPPSPLKLGVYVVEPFGAVVVDEAGRTEVGAELERERSRSPSGPALTETERRERAYRLYLKRHGWRPLRDVLEEMDR
jgi:serine/threonine protein kinase